MACEKPQKPSNEDSGLWAKVVSCDLQNTKQQYYKKAKFNVPM
jgi:hypothetical protein